MHSLILLLLSTQLPSTTSLRGTVVGAESGQSLGFSIVTLHPNGGQQFTSASGTFTFADTKAGTYVLSVRQIGYVPLDTQVVIADSTTVVRVTLRRLAIELPPVTITGQQCTNPGRPDSSDAALVAVFDQLQENARRLELLADSYPFHYTLELSERTVSQRGDTGRPVVRKLEFSSTEQHPYAVGRVVEPGYRPWDLHELVIQTGTLTDFNNTSFVANHCFRLAGRDTIAGEALVRIDFEPSRAVWSADLAGAAFLDSLTYGLRYVETSLTHPERTELDQVRAIITRTRFKNIAPGIPLQDSLWTVTTYRYRRGVTIQTQRTVDVRFRRQPPPAP
jgi:CarboxypepD_reg-like domain